MWHNNYSLNFFHNKFKRAQILQIKNSFFPVDYQYISMLKNLLILIIVALTHAQYSVISQDIGSTYIKLGLNYTGTQDYYVKTKSKIIKQLIFHFKALTYNEFTFKIYDPAVSRFQVPQGGIFPTDQQANFSFPLSIAAYKINFTTSHFSFTIVRKATDAVIFDSSVVELQFSEYYLQIGTILDSKTIFGYSERFTEHFKLQPGTWTVFNKDDGQQIDKGDEGHGKQTHGYYPAYLTRERSGNHNMGYFRTSNALDVEVQSFSNSSYLKIFRTIGGVIDFRFIVGGVDPQNIIQQFHGLLGKSLIPPFWALGFHQCRWGYKNISMLQTVLAKYKQNGLPLDTIWTDIDYMHEFQTFTVDTERFPLNRLNAIAKQYQYIPIVEPSVRNRVGYAYDQGKKRNIFIKAAEGNDLIGKVWAGEVLFTDYFQPNATQYWQDMMQYLYNQVHYSGIWLDMNEISNMCDGPCIPPIGQTVIDYSKDIPYSPGGGNIEQSTISLNATHYGNRVQANVHAFFGMMHSYSTYQYLKKKSGLPFIITRSTTLGSNRFSFHWTGDNYANFTFLKLSISSNFMFGLWGIQMVGSDICGFGGNATVQVCSRFFQLGSLYPFSRDHNQIDSIDQQPYALGPVVLECAKKNLKFRYSLLKFYYRQFIIRKGSGTIFRPLYYQFYEDENVLNDQILQTQFLIGRGLMSAPIVQQGKTQRTAYFPGDIWYNFFTGEVQQPKSLGVIQNKLTDIVPLFVRNGFIVFTQNVQNVTKTKQLTNRFNLIGGFKMLTTNSTHNVYVSEGGLLSLGDYNNDQDVLQCIADDCDYQIAAMLSVNKQTKNKELTLTNTHLGKTTIYEQQLSSFTIYTQTQTIKYTPASLIKIYGNNQQTIKFD